MPFIRTSARLAGALALAASGLAACASLEPEPCTPEWVDFKTEQITRPFVAKYRSEIRTLRDLSGDLENPGMLTTMRMIGQADTIAEMFEDFSETAVPDIRAAVAQCDQPRVASQLLVSMLEREGVEGDVINWIEALGILIDTQDDRATL